MQARNINDCPKCDGETENELQHSYFKADEVNDVSRCLNCGFEFYRVYRKHGKWREWHEHTGVSERYTNDMEPPTEEVSKTIEGSTEHLQPLRKKLNIDNLTILLHLWYILLGIGNLVRPLTSTTLIASYSLLFK